MDKRQPTDKPHASTSHSPEGSPDFIKKRALEVENTQKLLEGKEKELAKIEQLHKKLTSLREFNENLRELGASIRVTNRRMDSLRKEIKFVKDHIGRLSGKTLNEQRALLQELFKRGDTPSSMKLIIEAALGRVNRARKLDAYCEDILEHERSYSGEVGDLHQIMERAKSEVTEFLSPLGIKVKRKYFILDNNNGDIIDNPKECIKKLKELKELKELKDILYDESREAQCDEALKSTRFFRKKILVFFQWQTCKDYERAIRAFRDSKFAYSFDARTPTDLLPEVKKQIAKLKKRLNKLQRQAEEDANPYPAGTQPESFYPQAIGLYKAWLGQRRAIQTALEQADTLSQPDFTHALQTAITTPWDSEEAIKGAYKQFVEEHLMNKQYACIGHIYRDSLKALKAYDSAFEELDLLKKRLKSYHREDLPNAKAYQCTPSEVQEFEEKLKAFISAHIESKRIKKTKIRTKKSIIDYYNSLAKKPLQEKQSLNEAEVVSAQEGLLHLQPKIQDYKEQKATLEREIQEIAGGDPHYTKIAPNQLPKQLHDLAQQQSKLQGEIESLTTQLEATRHQQTLEARPKNPDRPLDESKLSEASLKALENDKVRRFTNSLARIYKSKYGEQFDPNQAVDSVLFLCRQGVLFDKPARYIEIAADLLHEFGASLMDFHFDRQTSQIKIKPELSEMKDLEPLRLTRHGVLRIGEQKLKSSVLASVGNTHTWIFSIRKRYAYNHELFAGDTPMQQSGGVDFEDLGKLKKDNKVDIFAIAIEREFREEAQGYELIPNTIQKDDQEVDPNTSTDHVVFFRAEAQQLSGPVPLFSPQSRETRGTFLVDIPEFIKKYQIDQCDFSDETDKTDHSKVMEAMLSEASKRKCITYPKEGEPRRHQFMTMSYNVKHTVDSIVKIVKAEREKEISWEFNPDKIGSGSNS